MQTYAHTCMHAYMHACMHACMHASIARNVLVGTYTCMPCYVHVYLYDISVCRHTHTHTFTSRYIEHVAVYINIHMCACVPTN